MGLPLPGVDVTCVLGALERAARIRAGASSAPGLALTDAVWSQAIACQASGAVVALLIYAIDATDSEHFESCASKMQPCYAGLNVPTWIVGPAASEDGALPNRTLDAQMVWPVCEPIQRMRLDEFNQHVNRQVEADARRQELTMQADEGKRH